MAGVIHTTIGYYSIFVIIMVLIYTEKVTNRVAYIFDTIFSHVLGIEYRLTSDEEAFKASRKPRFSYAKYPLGNELFFRRVELLYQRDIESQELGVDEFEGGMVLFPVHGEGSALPFDPFAASFYLVSRYEEYLPYVRDEYGRFEAAQSIAFKEGVLREPLVNIWAWKIAGLIAKRYKGFEMPEKQYRFIPTIDIDSAWYYRAKGLLRNLGGFSRSLSRLDLTGFSDRFNVLAGIQDDPFDTYSKQIELIKKYRLQLIYFILFSEYARNDKNLPVNNRKFHVLIKSLADYAQVGIHSSYNSTFSHSKLKMELGRLSLVLNREITMARQHFTRLNLPATYRNFLNFGIRTDFSMGYMHHPGFRAGICDPFPFYDLDLDHVTNLMIYPFGFAFTSSSAFTPDEKIKIVKDIIQRVRSVNGTMVIVWENAALSRQTAGDGWSDMFEQVIQLAHDNRDDHPYNWQLR